MVSSIRSSKTASSSSSSSSSKTTTRRFVLVMDILDNGLSDELHFAIAYSRRLLRGYAQQLLGMLGQLHARNVVHGDLSFGNLLLSKDTGRLVLADFGFAKSSSSPLSSSSSSSGLMPPHPGFSRGESSSFYTAPELLAKRRVVPPAAAAVATLPADKEKDDVLIPDAASAGGSGGAIIDNNDENEEEKEKSKKTMISYSSKVDIYSAGVMLLTMFLGPGIISAYKRAQRTGKVKDFWSKMVGEEKEGGAASKSALPGDCHPRYHHHLSQEESVLLDGMLQRDPEARWGMARVRAAAKRCFLEQEQEEEEEGKMREMEGGVLGRRTNTLVSSKSNSKNSASQQTNLLGRVEDVRRSCRKLRRNGVDHDIESSQRKLHLVLEPYDKSRTSEAELPKTEATVYRREARPGKCYTVLECFGVDPKDALKLLLNYFMSLPDVYLDTTDIDSFSVLISLKLREKADLKDGGAKDKKEEGEEEHQPPQPPLHIIQSVVKVFQSPDDPESSLIELRNHGTEAMVFLEFFESLRKVLPYRVHCYY